MSDDIIIIILHNVQGPEAQSLHRTENLAWRSLEVKAGTLARAAPADSLRSLFVEKRISPFTPTSVCAALLAQDPRAQRVGQRSRNELFDLSAHSDSLCSFPPALPKYSHSQFITEHRYRANLLISSSGLKKKKPTSCLPLICFLSVYPPMDLCVYKYIFSNFSVLVATCSSWCFVFYFFFYLYCGLILNSQQ